MPNPARFSRSLGCWLAAVLTVVGCRNSLEEVSDFETLDNGPAQTIDGADMEYSEDGVPTHRLRAAHMELSLIHI